MKRARPDPGIVYLVGAGPGDPGLITVRGLRLLQQADVIIYDRLVDPRLLRDVKPGAELINVGKARGAHSTPQQEINNLLLEKAREGKVVVRLKGGDPFVFGRGGEEAEALVEAGIPYAVVPGISSAVAVPAYAGIPVTHRNVASSFTVVSGAGAAHGKEPVKLFTTPDGTVVALMAWEGLDGLVTSLLREGRREETPAALIQWGTEPHQRVITATLGTIRERGRQAKLVAPVVLVVGEVVRLRDKLAWFEQRPLIGKRILVTGSKSQSASFSQCLEDAGAFPIETPVIEFKPLGRNAALDRAIAELSNYGWLVFSSPIGVELFFEQLKKRGKDARALARSKVCAIGSAAVTSLNAHGIEPDASPKGFSIEAIAQAVGSRVKPSARVLMHRTDQDSGSLRKAFALFRAQVREISLYRTVVPSGAEAQLREALANGVHAVTFTSSAAVHNFTSLLKGDLSLAQLSVVACIGPSAAESAKRQGLRVDVVAERHTTQGLVEALSSRLSLKD